MCIEPIPDEHEHVVNTESRSLMCTCRGCWLLFTSNGAGGGKYRAVPDRYLALDEPLVRAGELGRAPDPGERGVLLHQLPHGRGRRLLPESRPGATESLLPLDAWSRLVADNDVLTTLEPDVEALLVRRDDRHDEAYLVPIDACYELVGELRRLWKGFDGGTEARAAMDAFFARLQERSA